MPSFRRHTTLGRLGHSIRMRLFFTGFPVNYAGSRFPSEKTLNKWPIGSPFENTKNIYKALSEYAPTLLYHLTEKKNIKFNNNDVFIGHPYFPFYGDEMGVTELSLQTNNRPKVLGLITPLHCDTTLKTNHLNGAYLEHVNEMIEKADILFGIMGEYWWDEWDNSPYDHWKKKMVQLDMALDVKKYPMVKIEYNLPGKRKFIYIGDNTPNKGTEFLEILARNIGIESFAWIGSGPAIPGVHRIANSASLNPIFMKNIAIEYDFFINTSVADANPTTILESMAWGLPVICTPQSGYYETDYRFNIHADRLDDSIGVLKKLQQLPDQELHNIARQARTIVETNYNWTKFTDTIVKNLGLL